LLGEFLANERLVVMSLRAGTFFISAATVAGLGNSIFARAAKKSQAVVGNLDDGVVFGLHIVLLFVAFLLRRIGLCSPVLQNSLAGISAGGVITATLIWVAKIRSFGSSSRSGLAACRVRS
jgi:hypothetical protein